MKIGNIQQFKESQLSKVERRKEEEKQIKKGIYQMQMMIDCQNMETFDKECEKSKERTGDSRIKAAEAAEESREMQKTDNNTEMEKMLAVVGKGIGLKTL